MLGFVSWVTENNITDEAHGCSSIHTTWLLQETSSYTITRWSNVYVTLFDITNVVDSIWIEAFLYKLF